MKDLRIAFMGTPDFAVASLQALIQEGFAVVAAVTAPDRPAGRGQKLKAPAVKTFAEANGIPVLQPANLKDPEFAQQLRSLGVNLQVVVAFRMLPRQVWALPEYGTFNLHASLLPDYRGAAPINWALIRGETQTGVTTFFIDEHIDTGNIILQESLEIGPEENAGQLHDRLMALGAKLVVETVNRIAKGSVETTAQPEPDPDKQAPKLFREDCRIEWNTKASRVFNLIRGLSPYPAAWTILHSGAGESTCKIYASRLTDRPSDGQPGHLKVQDRELFVSTTDLQLQITEIQPEGKRRMSVSDWLNGTVLEQNDQFR
ncbi:methionyl-tRNA formyltransferase [Robiginitalea sp. SC105]|uniref:methionyl-tRNA formyltransferase n=1 Tax=Robiginitalea sp. SC105 TaxID=2762332 RepID=UPI00163A5265|nr:methionyl-tRNA formyltransferase [Robiginitalea sp. SC105]MBC2840370.1 methionyl-tRNA formyltransferase [Robiginitalea sp. SC105]